MTAREKRLEKAQTRVIFTVPFFASGVAKLPVRFDGSVDTAATDGTGIRWNPQFFDKLTDAQLVTVLCHETCHCLLGHIWRAPDGADWELWNQATDHAVNLMLQEFGAVILAKGLADPFPFPEPKEAFCADPSFKGMAEEVIYGRLAARKPKGGGKQPSGGQSAGNGQGASNSGQPGKPGQQPGKSPGAGGPAPGSMPSFGQVQQPAPGQQAASKALASDWQGTLIQSCKIAAGQGTLPAAMDRELGKAVNPQVPWWDLLRSWLREQCSDDCLARFQVEKQNCLDEMRPRALVDILCDARIQSVKEYAPGDTVDCKCTGGGGTDFRPVFEHVQVLPERVKAVVYLTDLYGTFPDADPGVPVIWVTWTAPGSVEVPFGEVVYVEKQ